MNIVYPNEENMLMMPNQEKNGDNYENPCSTFSSNNYDLRKKWEGKLFLNQNINILYPNEENMFTMPNHKENRDYYGYPRLYHFVDEL